MLSTEALLRISKEAGAPVFRVETTIALLDSGATVPFIARYRKEATGNLDEVKIRDIDERRAFYTALDERRFTVLSTIERQGKLTEELKQKILLAFTRNELEDLYLPYKPKRKTKALAALERGLGPLAEYIWAQTGEEPVEVFAEQFVTREPVPAIDPATPEAGPTAEIQGAAPQAAEPPVSASLESNSAEGDSAIPQIAEETQPSASASEAISEAASEAASEAMVPQPQAEEGQIEGSDTQAQEPSALMDVKDETNVEPASESDVTAADIPNVADVLDVADVADAEKLDENVASAEANVANVEESGTNDARIEGDVESASFEAPGPAESVPAPALETQNTPALASENGNSSTGQGTQTTNAPPAAPPQVTTVEQAIEGALHILAERIAETAEYRSKFREKLLKEGVVRAHVLPGKDAGKTKYEMYYKFEEAVPRIPSHRMLAIRRGSRENVLTYTIEAAGDDFVSSLLPQITRDSTSQFAPLLERAARDGFERLLAPSIQNEVRSILRERSEAEAIKVFEENLRTLLLAPPAGAIGVMGIDPGIRTGCKIAVVDETGKFLENVTVHLTDPHKDLEGAEKAILDLAQRHNVRAITIGNGTASRETEAFVRSVVQSRNLDVFVVVVSEAGASVYSASKRAREEFPALDITVRGAISIARRLQDPLSELVKIEPRSIGVGQYQHDVDQKKLKHSLESAVESCVNRVGVDLNTASEDLLKYVSGINDRVASTIIAHRAQTGRFQSRSQLMEVEGFGEKTFEQAAGFLRIKDGDNPLDRTAVHPESYGIVERISASLGVRVAELVENAALVNTVDFRGIEPDAGKYTLADIREELLRPGRDPRDKFVAPKYREDVKDVVDLQEGMELEGSVTNVTNFGAFVDLGVHQDGLVHISELSHRYVQDAREAVKVGDVVKVKVIGVDTAMKRISLSMKALQPKPPRRPRRKKRPREQEPPAPVAASGSAETPVATAVPAAAARRPSPPQTGRPAPPASKRPESRGPRPERQQKGKPEVSRPAPMQPAQTMDEKIRALQEKFGRVG